MRDKRLRTAGAIVILAAIAAAAVAQAGGNGSSSVELTADTTTTTAPDPTTSQPAPFHYRIGLLAPVSTTNYWAFLGEQPTVWNSYVLGPTKPSLYGLGPERHQVVADIASGDPPQPVEEGSSWVVEVPLNRQASWSDGTPITAGDVAFTFETVRDLELGGGWAEAYPEALIEVSAPAPDRVRLVFSRQPGLDLWPLSVGLAPIMPAHHWGSLLDQAGNAAELYRLDPAGEPSGGPLHIDSVGAEVIEAVANPGRDSTEVERMTYRIFPDEEAAVDALEAGAIDLILSPHGLSADAVESLQDQPGIEVTHSPANSIRFLGMNLGREPMSDPAFRTAVSLLVDRESLVDEVVFAGDPAYTLLTPANRSWYQPGEAEEIVASHHRPLQDRLEEAVALLIASGYGWETPPVIEAGRLVPGQGLTIDGQPPAPLTILTPGEGYDPVRPALAESIAETIAALGFEARPVVTDFDTVVDLITTVDAEGQRPYDMYLLGWTLGNPGLPDYHSALLAPDAAANSTGYADVAFSDLLTAYQDATDLDTARSILWEMERKIASDLPYLMLYHPQIAEAHRSDRVSFRIEAPLGGLQGLLGGIGVVEPAMVPRD